MNFLAIPPSHVFLTRGLFFTRADTHTHTHTHTDRLTDTHTRAFTTHPHDGRGVDLSCLFLIPDCLFVEVHRCRV